MIELELNSSKFENDVRSLVSAFFPSAVFKAVINDMWQDIPDDRKDTDVSEIKLRIYQDDMKMLVQYYQQEKKLDEEREATVSTERKPQKDQLKKMIYRILSKHCRMELPWGTLTGIRPTKIARVMLQENKSAAEIERHLKELYYVSEEKSELSIQIARNELEALKGIPYYKEYSLYVGIPFCPSTCAYCSFTSYPVKQWEQYIDTYIRKLCLEIDGTIQLFGRNKLTAIYVGGGTPTTLQPAQLDRLLAKLRESAIGSNLRELTVEAGRPDSVTKEKLQVLKSYGVSRISINPQTMQQTTLARIGRKHTVRQTLEAFELARRMGFDNINMDLIVGLPGETIRDVEDTMNKVRGLQPDSLTVHSLAVKRAAKLNIFKEQYEQYKSVNTQEIIDLTGEYAEAMGLIPYYLYRQKNISGNFENVGYAKKDKAGIYNILIMEEMQTIAAVGAGASTKIVIPGENRIERVENVKDVRNYIDRLDEMLERKRRQRIP